MAALEIRKAERAKSKLRIGLSGPSGSGKTYSALLIARGLSSAWEKVLLIDTENGSGELYSDLGSYNVITLEAPYSPERYIEAITAGEKAGMETIIIDSVSHEWDGKGGCLQINELLAQTKFKGNSWGAWSETTPRHQKFLDAITASSCHLVTSARSKTDTIQTEDKKIKKVGLKDIQRDGFEYELTVAFNIDRERHTAIASKDRTKLFDSRDPFVITEDTGKELLTWNEGGADRAEIDAKRKIFQLLTMLDKKPTSPEEAAANVLALTQVELKPEHYAEIVALLEGLAKKAQFIASQKVEAPVATAAPQPAAEPEKKEDPAIEALGRAVADPTRDVAQATMNV